MKMITYKRPTSDLIFLILMPIGIFYILRWKRIFIPNILWYPGAICAMVILFGCVLVLFIGISKMTYDGKRLVITYGFGYTREIAAQDITRVGFKKSTKHGATLLVYLKNGEKFSRGLTGKNAEPFVKELSALWN